MKTFSETIIDIATKQKREKPPTDYDPIEDIYNHIIELLEDSPYIPPVDKQLHSSIKERYNEIEADREIQFYAKKFYDLLVDYFMNIQINKDTNVNKITVTREKKGKTKVTHKPKTIKVKEDIRVINDFLALMQENCIYNHEIENSYANKQDGKFVYEYCKLLIDDLETEKFDKSTIYKITELKATKEKIKDFFTKLRIENRDLLTVDVKQFIDEIPTKNKLTKKY